MALIESSIDNHHDLTIHTITGKVSEHDIIRKIEQYYSGKYTLNDIWDFSKADVSGLSAGKLHLIARVAKKYIQTGRGGRSALVLPKDISFGLGRMYETIAELEEVPTENRSFRNMEDAKRWLNGLK